MLAVVYPRLLKSSFHFKFLVHGHRLGFLLRFLFILFTTFLERSSFLSLHCTDITSTGFRAYFRPFPVWVWDHSCCHLPWQILVFHGLSNIGIAQRHSTKVEMTSARWRRYTRNTTFQKSTNYTRDGFFGLVILKKSFSAGIGITVGLTGAIPGTSIGRGTLCF